MASPIPYKFYNVFHQDGKTYVNITPAFVEFAQVHGIEPKRVILAMGTLKHHSRIYDEMKDLFDLEVIGPDRINLIIKYNAGNKKAMQYANQIVSIIIPIIYNLVIVARTLGHLGVCCTK